jgi:alpha-1,6-mannosyltransferase
MAAAEARASGIPVVVPDRGGAADHAGGGAGVRYTAGNPQAAAQAILDVFSGTAELSSEPVPVVTMADHFATLFADYERLIGARAAA